MLGTFLILLTLLILILVIVNKIHRHYKYWHLLKIPCEQPNWIFGNLQGALTKRTFFQIWQDYYRRYRNSGPFAGFYWFFKRAVFVMDPPLVKQILIKDFNKFPDRGLFYNEHDDPLSAHLFNMEGSKWKNLRHKLTPTFTSGKIKLMFPAVVQVGQEMLKVLGENVQAYPKVDVRNVASRYTTDVIGTCAFGIDCNSLRDPQQKFHLMSKRAFVEHHLGAFGVAFRLSFPKLARRLRMRGTVHEVEDFFMNTLRETARYREETQVQRNDFIDLLLELKNNKIIKNEEGNGPTNLTFNEIAAQAFVFLVAGSETSSNTMTFALYELGRHPNIQQQARVEIERVLHDQELTYESMSEMKYLQQIVEETLRLHTPLPVLNRIAVEDYVVPGYPEYVIRKDMIIIIPSISIHRDEQYYPNPDEFNPDNFSSDKVALRDPILHLPFGDGPRNCIGLRFGKMQILVGLSLLLKHYKFSVCEETPIPLTYDKENFMLTPEKEVFLKVCKI